MNADRWEGPLKSLVMLILYLGGLPWWLRESKSPVMQEMQV